MILTLSLALAAKLVAEEKPDAAQDQAAGVEQAVTPPRPLVDPASVVDAYFYSREELGEFRESTVRVRLDVGRRGTSTACRVVTSSGRRELDAVVCSQVRGRVRFEPARDGGGNPVAASFTATLRLAPPAPVPLRSGSSLTRYGIGKDGTPASCTVAISGSVPQAPGGPCGEANLPARGEILVWLAREAGDGETLTRLDAFEIEGEAAVSALPLPAGFTVFSTQSYRIEIGRNGWLVDCEPTGQWGRKTSPRCPLGARYAMPPGAQGQRFAKLTVTLATNGSLSESVVVLPPPLWVENVRVPAPPAPPGPHAYPSGAPPRAPMTDGPRPVPPPPPPPSRPTIAEKLAPLTDPMTWITDDDYPFAAIQDAAQGTTGFVLTVDARGTVVDCQVTSSSGWELLDASTCDLLMARSRFKPARDFEGRPVAATFRSRMRWQIPRD